MLQTIGLTPHQPQLILPIVNGHAPSKLDSRPYLVTRVGEPGLLLLEILHDDVEANRPPI